MVALPNVADAKAKTNGKAVKSKNQLRRLKAKERKAAADPVSTRRPAGGDVVLTHSRAAYEKNGPPGAEAGLERARDEPAAEYVAEPLDLGAASLQVFSDVFARFQLPADASSVSAASLSRTAQGVLILCPPQHAKDTEPSKGEIIYSDDDMPSDADSDAPEARPMSKRKQRKLARLTVAELKQLVKKPEVVEWTDVTASDPRLLLQLKSYRNTIPVPAHWSAKRDYLQGKRGIEKPPFQLPAYIADTGVATMREAVKEKEANMSLKAKTRERVQPKMGKMDIDYQKLHDAFFKFQTKPPVTGFGEM